MVAVVECQCGPKRIATGCGRVWICPACRKRYYRRARKRIIRATRTWSSAKRGRGWRWRLLRLSTKHSGDIEADRAEIQRGWQLLRQSLTKRIGRFPYVMTWEVTAGSDGLGHVHAHVIALWPFVDWSWVARRWRESCPGSNHIRIETAKKDAKGAAVYAAKYASKGVDVESFSGVMAGRVLAVQYGKRKVNASAGFWAPVNTDCRDCGAPQHLRQKPAGMNSLAPIIEWHRWRRRFRSTMDPPEQLPLGRKERSYGPKKTTPPAPP